MADRFLYVALAVSLIGILTIAYVSPSIRPPLVDVCDVSAASLEKRVRFVGQVHRTHTFKGGSVIMDVADGGCALDVYVTRPAALELDAASLNGSIVEVAGDVRLYRGRLEVFVDSPGQVVSK